MLDRLYMFKRTWFSVIRKVISKKKNDYECNSTSNFKIKDKRLYHIGSVIFRCFLVEIDINSVPLYQIPMGWRLIFYCAQSTRSQLLYTVIMRLEH